MIGLVIDNFAGGGGASTGIEAALGRAVDIAINHDPEAVAMHAANHPGTVHYCQSVWRADPAEVVAEAGGGPVALAWFSPDCKHFSKAKGGKPVEKHIRDLAWVVVLWAQRVRPAVIMLENVEEFRTWGPLGADGQPDKALAGTEFARWKRELKRAGYRIEHRELRACDYGAPTSRKRLFLIARCDGKPIVWPAPTHGRPGSPDVEAGRLKPWRSAAEIIDWTLPCPSIFERARPLKEATLRRIAHGVMRYVVNAARPFIVPITHSGGDGRVHDLADPLRTVTTASRGELAVVSPTIVRTAHGEVDASGKRRGKGDHGPSAPLPTVTASRDFALSGATLIQSGYGERPGQAPRVPHLDKPLGAVVAGGEKHALVAGMLSHFYTSNTNGGRGDPREPFNTATAGGQHHAVVAAALEKFSENSRGRPVTDPLDTVMAGASRHGVIAAHMEQANTGMIGRAADAPLSTIVHRGTQQRLIETTLVPADALPPELMQRAVLTAAFLVKYYSNEVDGHGLDRPIGTVTTKDRFAVVTVTIDAATYILVDIGMRMLTPRELARAQGFPDSYVLAPLVNGKPLTKTAQIRMIGNSVCPPMSEALVRANLPAAEAEPEGLAA